MDRLDLIALLRMIEWNGQDGSCPNCGFLPTEGHQGECELERALNDLGEE